VWDLRYEASAGRRAADPTAAGVWAAPGTYTAVLEADGRRLAAMFEVKPDPRSKLAPGDYASAFASAEAIETMRGRIAQASGDAEKVHAALLSAAEGTGVALGTALRDAAADLQHIADLDLGKDIRNTVRPDPENISGLRALAAEGGRLARAVDGADGAPTADATAGTAHFLNTAESTLAAWARFRADVLPSIDARLRAAGGRPLALER
jgi:hypothetical protein